MTVPFQSPSKKRMLLFAITFKTLQHLDLHLCAPVSTPPCMGRGLNLLVALACQGSPILDALLPLGLVQTALGPLKSFAADLDTSHPSSSLPAPSSSGRDDVDGAGQRNALSQQDQAATQSSALLAQQQSANTSYRDQAHDAAVPQQRADDPEMAVAHLATDVARGGGAAEATDTRQPVTSTIADSALRVLEVSSLSAWQVMHPFKCQKA